jgi:hypothetical protein
LDFSGVKILGMPSQIWGMSKTPTTAVKFQVVGKIRALFPSFANRSRLVRSASGDDGRNYFMGEGTIRL